MHFFSASHRFVHRLSDGRFFANTFVQRLENVPFFMHRFVARLRNFKFFMHRFVASIAVTRPLHIPVNRYSTSSSGYSRGVKAVFEFAFPGARDCS